MSLLDDAIAGLEREVLPLQSMLLARIISPSSQLWWVLQAKSLGLSYLRTMKQQGVTDPVVADQLRKEWRTEMQPLPEDVDPPA